MTTPADSAFNELRISPGYFGDPAHADYKERRRAVTEQARSDFDELLCRVRVDLAAPARIADGERQAAIYKIYASAHNLHNAFANDGYDALLQRIGADRTFDVDSEQAGDLDFLRDFARKLDRLIKFTKPATAERPKRGRPDDSRRTVAVARIAGYYERWTGKPPSASRDTPFARLTTSVFELLGQPRAGNLQAHARKVLALRRQAVNLGTWGD